MNNQNLLTSKSVDQEFVLFPFKLDLHALEGILEDVEVRINLFSLVELEENDSFWGHGLSSVEFIIIEVAQNFLNESSGSYKKVKKWLLTKAFKKHTCHEWLDTVWVGGLEVSLNSLHVSLDVGSVRLLIKEGLR